MAAEFGLVGDLNSRRGEWFDGGRHGRRKAQQYKRFWRPCSSPAAVSRRVKIAPVRGDIKMTASIAPVASSSLVCGCKA